MQRLLISLVCLGMIASGNTLCRAAQEGFGSQSKHRWGHFNKGAWKKIRVLEERYDDKGKMSETSTVNTTIDLVAVDAKAYTLRIDVTVEVMGRIFSKNPQMIALGYYEQPADQKSEVKVLGNGNVTLHGKTIPCTIHQVTVTGTTTKRVTTVYFNKEVFPYILRQKTVCTSLDGKVTQYETSVEMVETALLYRVKADTLPTAFVKTIHKTPKSTTITLEVYCPKVPGGVVARWDREIDNTGHLIRRSILELRQYGITPREKPKKQP